MDNLFTSTEFYIVLSMMGTMVVIDIFLPFRAARWLPVFAVVISCAVFARYAGLV